MEKQCIHCKTILQVNDGRVFSNHVRWCKYNPNYEKIKNSTVGKVKFSHQQRKTQQLILNELQYQKNPRKCKKCESNISYPDHLKHRLYCQNTECRLTAKTAANQRMKEKAKTEKKQIVCKTCSNTIYVNLQSRVITCSTCKEIKAQQLENNKIVKRKAHQNSLEYYRSCCKFNFNLSDYPEEFDFVLIEKYGWYKPINRGNNLNGISRDHMVSVKYGFTNNIDPSIIAHPANCRLVLHKENISKNSDCCITYEELVERINKWNKKYGVVAQ